jgi:EAL domain-containing protein (putative c-di-GMP-specific phosphodiesterase class I)
MKVIVEGVDSPAHQAILIEIGCDYLQGYGLARPMSPNHLNFHTMLATQYLDKH